MRMFKNVGAGRRVLKRGVLSRYERDDKGNIVIDVSATRVEHLYNDFDKGSPYVRRDLEQDFADYLIDCARALGKAPFVIRFTFEHPPGKSGFARIRRSLNTYFDYLADSEIQEIL